MSRKVDKPVGKVSARGINECEFRIEGMDCASCALKVENKLRQTEGVADVKIMVTAEKAAVYFDRARTDPARIKEAIRRIGYQAEESEAEEEVNHKIELARLALTAVAVLASWSGIWRGFPGFDIFSVVVVAVAGVPIYLETYTALRARNITIEVAMTIGIIASIAIGEFLAAAVIVLFTLFADYLDGLTTDRGRRAIRELLKIFPQEATVLRDGSEVRTKIDHIGHDELIVVRPGERIPVDGRVVEGETHVNQAPITGESKPVNKGPSDRVLAGSIADGVLKIKVTQVGRDTALGRIIRLVEEAEGTKSRVQKFADRFSARFVPGVVALAALVYLATGTATTAIATIVVACPCAIALATPLAVVASAGRAARHGIIIKGGVFLEELSKIDTVVLDKTGTLTLGEPRITDIASFAGHAEEEVLTIAAAAEKYSEHPLAKAVLKEAGEYGLEVPAPIDFEAVKGQGVKAKLAGGHPQPESKPSGRAGTGVLHDHRLTLLGNPVLFKNHGLAVPEEAARYMESREENGETVVLVGHEEGVCGAIAIADVVRKETRTAVEDLRRLGLESVVMLTGDSRKPAKHIASVVGIDEVQAQLLPEDKVKAVQALTKTGRRDLMVGDGVNDAPALAHANVGMAMGVAGSDVAIEAADVALMTNDLGSVAKTVRIGRRTFRIIRQNIYGSIAFNVVGIALASTGFLTPLMAAVAHAVPDVLLFLNSSRLLRK